MIAYNRRSLDNQMIREQAEEAFVAGCITGEENIKIGETHPVNFYTPNIFICIGLFVLTVVIATSTLGIFFLIGSGSSGSATALLFFFAILCYAALEFIIHNRRHFKSGVDYALMWMSAGLLCTALYLTDENMSVITLCGIVFIVSLLFTIRFANNIMMLVCYGALLVLIFNIASVRGGSAILFLPFIIMFVSIATWFVSARMYDSEILRHYRPCIIYLKTATLISFYAAGNYFVVRELANDIHGSNPSSNGGMPMGWLFLTLTIVTPLLYIFHGVRKKNALFLRTGLALIAATIFTIRHYYNALPAEWAMLWGGISLIILSYVLIKYLRIPRHGFTSLESDKKNALENLQIESLIIAETFAAPSSPASNDFQFGGGSGGGAGAGGEY